MSGLFVAHIRCPSCGLIGPVFDLAPALSGPPVRRLPSAQALPPRLGTVVVAAEGEALTQIANGLSSATYQVAVPRMFVDGRIGLHPPLRCPRCGGALVEALPGGPQPEIEAVSTLEQIVAQTRNRDRDPARRFDLPAARVICAPFREDGREGNHWRLVRHGEETDVLTLARSLRARLECLGSRCDEPDGTSARVGFIEWVAETDR